MLACLRVPRPRPFARSRRHPRPGPDSAPGRGGCVDIVNPAIDRYLHELANPSGALVQFNVYLSKHRIGALA